jgi:hypothetical protein
VTEPDREPQFILDIVATDHLVYLSIECTYCMWMIELETPITQIEVNLKTAHHTESCKC